MVTFEYCSSQDQLGARFATLSQSVTASLTGLRRSCVASQMLQRQLLTSLSGSLSRRPSGSIGRLSSKSAFLERRGTGGSLLAASHHTQDGGCLDETIREMDMQGGGGFNDHTLWQLRRGIVNRRPDASADGSIPATPVRREKLASGGFKRSAVSTPRRTSSVAWTDHGIGMMESPFSNAASLAPDDTVYALFSAVSKQLNAIDDLADQVRCGTQTRVLLNLPSGRFPHTP